MMLPSILFLAVCSFWISSLSWSVTSSPLCFSRSATAFMAHTPVIELLLALVQQGSADVDDIVIVIGQVGQRRDELADEVGVQLGRRWTLPRALSKIWLMKPISVLAFFLSLILATICSVIFRKLSGVILLSMRLEGLLRQLLLWVGRRGLSPPCTLWPTCAAPAGPGRIGA